MRIKYQYFSKKKTNPPYILVVTPLGSVFEFAIEANYRIKYLSQKTIDEHKGFKRTEPSNFSIDKKKYQKLSNSTFQKFLNLKTGLLFKDAPVQGTLF
jgi:hypothetical protein